MNYAAFAGVVVGDSVILIRDGLPRPISGGRNCGFAFATADDFNAAMVDCDGVASFRFWLNVGWWGVIIGVVKLWNIK